MQIVEKTAEAYVNRPNCQWASKDLKLGNTIAISG
jgi:hypothetical protein